MKTPHPLTTTPFRFNLALTWLIGCALAVLALQLTGCGEVTATQDFTDAGTASRGKPLDTLDRGGGTVDSALMDVSDVHSPGESDSQPNTRVDGGSQSLDLGIHVETGADVSPVCPVGLNGLPLNPANVGPKECLPQFPDCTVKVDGKCYSDGWCVCR